MGLPRVILHNAVSVDGRIDWFSADVGLFYELTARWQEDATLAGADTFLDVYSPAQLADAGAPHFEPPRRDPDDRRPLLAIPDSRGRLRCWHLLRREPHWRDCVALCSSATPEGYRRYLQESRVDCVIAGDDQVDMRRALEELHARYGVKVVRVDSGGTLNGVLLRAGLVDEVSILVHPGLVGGASPRSIFRAPDLDSSEGVVSLKLTHLEQVRDDIVWLRYDVVK